MTESEYGLIGFDSVRTAAKAAETEPVCGFTQSWLNALFVKLRALFAVKNNTVLTGTATAETLKVTKELHIPGGIIYLK